MASTKNQKLELTWAGKDKQTQPEPRILLEQADKSYGDQNTENMLIHGDNLLALKSLEADFAGKIKCIYIDPPYNTGNAFEHYDDGYEHSIWLSLMRDRLEILRNLLSEDGSIWIQIDDNEQAYLKVLCDEVFGRANFVNMIAINMKNIAGASGGGEDTRLKKNCEYILVYAKDYYMLDKFKSAYTYTEIGELVEQYKQDGTSWKYTSVLYNPGDKEYIGSTLTGDGEEIKIYKRTGSEIKSVGQIAKIENITERQVYNKYSKQIFQTAMPQSSIRPRVMKAVKDLGVESDLFSIEYCPKTGRNKGVLYEQFYKGGDSFRLFAWLRDVSEEIDGVLYKKQLTGTYWDFVGETKNLSKEGSVVFANGKKPERLLQRIFEMTTSAGDLVLDSFLGSGTTAAVAHKMGRRWIGIELGDHAYTHCIPRLKSVVDGMDTGGISRAVNWAGGGGFKFYELASSLIVKDARGFDVISNKYNADMLAEAMCKIMGYKYRPDKDIFWKQGRGTEKNWLFTTTMTLTEDYLEEISTELGDESLLVCCGGFTGNKNAYKNIQIKKIPKAILEKCEWNKPGYPLPVREDFTEQDFELED